MSRYSLVRFGEGGVLVDLESGAYYQLNESACHLAEKDPSRIEALVPAAGPIVPPELFSFNGLELRIQGKGVARIDPSGRTVEAESEQARLWAAPHMLLLQGKSILHASAVRRGDGVVAFCGASGSGKSTLAKLFSDVVAEDLLVVEGAAAIEGGEPWLREWAAKGGVLDVATMPDRKIPLSEMLFVDRGERGGTDLVTTALAPSAAFAELLRNSFAELGRADVWRRLVTMSEAIVRGARCGRLTVPEGLGPLKAAVSAFAR